VQNYKKVIHRLYVFAIGWCLCITFLHCKKRSSAINTDILDKEKCYLVFRGTNTKEGLVSKEYNIANNKPSHVGICIFQNSEWIVYHVLSPRKKNVTALIRENFGVFLDTQKESIYNASIWAIDNLTTYEILKLRKELHKYEQIHLKFDLSFKSKDTTTLYCSKFVNDVLRNVNNKKFKFKTSKVRLKPLHSVYLAQDSLDYYPVDLFQLSEDILLIKEWTFH
jgi:hypothetical protein